MSDDVNRIFRLEEIFPDVDGIFLTSMPTLQECKNNSLFVFDTNALLLPYEMNTSGIPKLKELYKELISTNSLFIPKRVAREFAKLRNKKLGEIFQAVRTKKSIKHTSNFNAPILSDLKEKKKLDKAYKDLQNAEKKYFESIDNLANVISSWGWSDPVSLIYSDLFKRHVFIDHDKTHEEIEAELKRRNELKIPPGYKDSSKADDGVGDLIIWLSILNLASSKQKNIVFITQETKQDWWNKSDGTAFLPRYELIDEFRRISNGKSIHIIQFSQLLDLFEIDQPIVDSAIDAEVKNSNKKGIQDEMLKNLALYGAKQDIEKKKKFKAINDALTKYSGDKQIETIKKWFYANYENPAECSPYDTKKGGYEFVFGGPYYAEEEINNRYSGEILQSVINLAIDQINSQNGCIEWTKNPESFF